MFSDFENHVAGIPQIAPLFGAAHEQHDLRRSGRERGLRRDADLRRSCGQVQVPHGAAPEHRGCRRRSSTTARSRDWKMRFASTSIRRNAYNPAAAGIDKDLSAAWGRALTRRIFIRCSAMAGSTCPRSQIRDVTQFVKTGLLDPRAKKENLCSLIPKFVPSKLKVLTFEACEDKPGKNRPLTPSGTRDWGLADQSCSALIPSPESPVPVPNPQVPDPSPAGMY